MAKRKKPAQGKVAMPDEAIRVGTGKPVIVEGNDLPTFYVNNVNIDMSSWDVRFRLGQIQGLQGSALAVKEIAVMFMSHAHTKAFLEALKNSVEKLDKMPPPIIGGKRDETTH